MKRFISLLSIFILFLFISCSFTNNSNTVVLTLPSYNVSRAAEEEVPAEVSEETEPEKPVVYNFEITLTDSDSVVQNKSAKSGEEILFSEVPVGTAAISIIAYNEENVACYSGNLTFEVVEGENQITIPVKKLITEDEENSDEDTDKETSEETPEPEPEPTPELFYITINFPNSVSRYETSKENFSATDLLVLLESLTGCSGSSYKQLLIYYNNSELDLSNADAVATFTSELNSSTELTVKAAVKLSDYSDYLSSDEVQENETIYFIQDDASIIEIPAKPSSKSANATGFTLDFSDCKNLTSINLSAFNNALDKWVDVLKLPSSIQTINGIRAVNNDVYMPLPDGNLSFGGNVSYGTGDSYLSTYAFHFGGTLADWCGRVSLSTTADSHPFYNKNYAKNVYFLDSDGYEYSTAQRDIEIEDEYTMADGSKADLTVIPKNAFRWLKCESIKIPDSVTEIKDTAFCYNSAKTVFIGSRVTTIASGAFYYDLDTTFIDGAVNGPRTVKYNGTIADWMNISTDASTSEAAGGPLNGASNFYIKNDPSSDYSNAVEEGFITVTLLDPEVTYIVGQFQGFKGNFKLKVLGSTSSENFTIGNSAFYNCSGLSLFDATPYLTIKLKAFENCSSLVEIILRSTTQVNLSYTLGYSTFDNLENITVKVPPALLSVYQNAFTNTVNYLIDPYNFTIEAITE